MWGQNNWLLLTASISQYFLFAMEFCYELFWNNFMNVMNFIFYSFKKRFFYFQLYSSRLNFRLLKREKLALFFSHLHLLLCFWRHVKTTSLGLSCILHLIEVVSQHSSELVWSQCPHMALHGACSLQVQCFESVTVLRGTRGPPWQVD